MIRIRLSDKEDYADLREKYLENIVKYISFDEDDILENPRNHGKGSSRETGMLLKQNYPELYDFLYKSGKVRKEKLRILLAGPETMPGSFEQSGSAEGTMRDFFENIPLRPLSDSKKNEKDRKAREICERIFSYSRFIAGQQEAYWLLRRLDVRVCPYCNRIYTVTLPTKEELEKEEDYKTTRAAFDHFYPKSRYPYLALNLFNLVPCCGICNSNKSDSEQELIYPYDEAFEKNAVFRLVPDLPKESDAQTVNVLGFLHGENCSFHIKFMGKDGISLLKDASLEYRLNDIENKAYRTRIIHSIRQFKLEEIYKEHKAEILDILKNRYYFNEQYVLYAVCPLIREKMKGAGELSKEQIRDIAMDMLFFSRLKEQEWEKRPLSKLIADLLD